MNWCDERYVRLYTRDTVSWLSLSFEAQGLLALIIRKVDRAGVLELGGKGKRGVAVAVGHGARWTTLEPALEELLEDGVAVIDGPRLVMPNFLEAQEAKQSDRARQAESRARRRELADTSVTPRDGESRTVTDGHDLSQPVTGGHAESHDVTPSVPSRAVPSRAVPSLTIVAAPQLAEARGVAEYLLEAIRSHRPDAKGDPKGWAKDIDLAIRVDGRSVEDLTRAIDQAHRSSDPFWRPNLLSGKALRKQCDRLLIKASQQTLGGPRASESIDRAKRLAAMALGEGDR